MNDTVEQSQDHHSDDTARPRRDSGYGEAVFWGGLLGLLAHAIELFAHDRLFTWLGLAQLLLGTLLMSLFAALLLAACVNRIGGGLLFRAYLGLMGMGASVRILSVLLTGAEFADDDLPMIVVHGFAFTIVVFVLAGLASRRWTRL